MICFIITNTEVFILGDFNLDILEKNMRTSAMCLWTQLIHKTHLLLKLLLIWFIAEHVKTAKPRDTEKHNSCSAESNKEKKSCYEDVLPARLSASVENQFTTSWEPLLTIIPTFTFSVWACGHILSVSPWSTRRCSAVWSRSTSTQNLKSVSPV